MLAARRLTLHVPHQPARCARLSCCRCRCRRCCCCCCAVPCSSAARRHCRRSRRGSGARPSAAGAGTRALALPRVPEGCSGRAGCPRPAAAGAHHCGVAQVEKYRLFVFFRRLFLVITLRKYIIRRPLTTAPAPPLNPCPPLRARAHAKRTVAQSGRWSDGSAAEGMGPPRSALVGSGTHCTLPCASSSPPPSRP